MQTEEQLHPNTSDYTALVEKLQDIEIAVARVEAALAPIVQFFDQIKSHPMLSKMLGG